VSLVDRWVVELAYNALLAEKDRIHSYNIMMRAYPDCFIQDHMELDAVWVNFNIIWYVVLFEFSNLMTIVWMCLSSVCFNSVEGFWVSENPV